MNKTQSGFSLVEMIAVILLLGIIAGFVAPAVFGKVDQGRWNATKSSVKSLGTKIESYAMDVGSLPENLEDLTSKPGNAENWNGPYARPSELKDGWDQPFVYRMPGETGADYDLISFGADKQPGGEKWKRDISNAD